MLSRLIADLFMVAGRSLVLENRRLVLTPSSTRATSRSPRPPGDAGRDRGLRPPARRSAVGAAGLTHRRRSCAPGDDRHQHVGDQLLHLRALIGEVAERGVALPPQRLPAPEPSRATRLGRRLPAPPPGGQPLRHRGGQRPGPGIIQPGAQLLVVPGGADQAGRGPLGAVQRPGPAADEQRHRSVLREPVSSGASTSEVLWPSACTGQREPWWASGGRCRPCRPAPGRRPGRC